MGYYVSLHYDHVKQIECYNINDITYFIKSMPFFEEMPKWGQQDNVKFHNFALNYLYYLIEMGEMLGVKIYIAVPILG